MRRRLSRTPGGLDPERFLREVEEHHAGVLAARPVTLLFLLNLARQGPLFPRTRVELYRQGCALLCAEENNARRESGRVGNRTPKERMMIAARIATVLLICNRESVWRGPHSELDSIRDCSVNDLVGPMLSPDDGAIQLTQQDVLETLDTGLFWLHGPQRSHFVHQSYAEFLAAWYLQQQRMSTAFKLALLSDPETGGLVPQLHEVAAWSAALDRDLFESLLEVHPPVLLTSDAATAAAELRADLVGKLLQLADSAQCSDSQWKVRRFYGHLQHPDITSQLEPWIADRDRFVVAHRIAIDIAEACGLAQLQDVLISVALDALDEAPIRGQAIDALAALGDQRHREMLRPLLALTSEKGVPRSGFSVLTPDRTWDLETLGSGLLETLVARRSPESVAAIERIAAVHPDVPWLRVLRSRAHESLRRTLWQPPRPAELLLLTVDQPRAAGSQRGGIIESGGGVSGALAGAAHRRLESPRALPVERV